MKIKEEYLEKSLLDTIVDTPTLSDITADMASSGSAPTQPRCGSAPTLTSPRLGAVREKNLVVWIHSDDFVPAGTVGTLTKRNKNKGVVRFPRGTVGFPLKELKKAPAQVRLDADLFQADPTVAPEVRKMVLRYREQLKDWSLKKWRHNEAMRRGLELRWAGEKVRGWLRDETRVIMQFAS